MLVGALRSDNPLGGAPLTCDDVTESFTLQGVGEISAAKLLDLENRRQLVWSDLVTREWVLETAAVRVRREAAARPPAPPWRPRRLPRALEPPPRTPPRTPPMPPPGLSEPRECRRRPPGSRRRPTTVA